MVDLKINKIKWVRNQRQTGVLLTFKILLPHSEGDCGHPHTQRPSRGAQGSRVPCRSRDRQLGPAPSLRSLAPSSPLRFLIIPDVFALRGEINTSLGRSVIRPPNVAAPHRPPGYPGNCSLSPRILQSPPSRSLSSPGTPSPPHLLKPQHRAHFPDGQTEARHHPASWWQN